MSVPFPFVVGFARSGTTLVRAMLDSHPEMAIPGESHFIVSLARDRDRYEARDGFDSASFLHDLLEHPRFAQWGLGEDEVLRSLEPERPTDYADAIRRIYALYARRQGKPRFGDKTPKYVMNISLLAELFPEARFVHVVRDGRDVCLSHLDVSVGQRTVGRVALYWMRHVKMGRSAGERVGSRRYRELRYEDLVAEPEATMRSLCGFLDLSYDPKMLRFSERADEIRRTTRHPEVHGGLDRPPTQGLRDWRREMPREDLALFEALAGGLLSDLGYERSGQRPSGLTRLETRVRATRVRAAVLAHRVRRRFPASARS